MIKSLEYFFLFHLIYRPRSIDGKRTSVRHMFYAAHNKELIKLNTWNLRQIQFFFLSLVDFNWKGLFSIWKPIYIQKWKWQINRAAVKKEARFIINTDAYVKIETFFFAFAYLYSWRNFRQKEATLVCKKNLALEQNRHFFCNTYSRCVITNKLYLFHMISAI